MVKKVRLKGGDHKGSDRGKHRRNAGYRAGDNWVVCDVCGCDVYSSEAKVRWDGLVCCKQDWEPRQEQDFVRARQDKIAADGLVRPPGEDVFLPDLPYNPDGGGGVYPPEHPNTGPLVGVCFVTLKG